ncbi:hypothetical protein A3A38_01340 [Candidatus Kaiserbacteria bacterium RIFCSPLOWO2_01_FULL_53_17]|uniref:Uncharacterized protein n=1 Tax=Candidatus Kaiserbacteria bacterium RIFCSPLOWO2_01_FULL_53_17 TaxID=1798511 RepID=A0A1F6EI74_9BACT|nr:MAG: hypothetical protein A3A38_01340 [Candidatus Kaiserbacteria bacterium RIFCSPLOWO2_01_FULL_53_17]
MFMERKTFIRWYIVALRKRVKKWADNEMQKLERGSCILLDLTFAEQWLDAEEIRWAWGCVENARKLAQELKIIRAIKT